MQVHFNFLLRQNRVNKLGESPIVLRIIFRGERRDLYTGLYCKIQEWDSYSGMMNPLSKKSISINKNLDIIKFKAIQFFDELKFRAVPFTIEELVNRIKGHEEKPVLLAEYLDKRKMDLKKRILFEISSATYEKYERVLRFTLEFIKTESNLKNYPLAHVDPKFLEKFFQYLRSTRKIENNTSVKYLGALKTLLMPVIKDGIIRNNPFLGLKFKSKKYIKGI